MTLLFDAGVMDKSMRDRLVMREIGEEMLRQGTPELIEKSKLHLAGTEADEVQLSDDGELVPVEKPEKQHRDQAT